MALRRILLCAWLGLASSAWSAPSQLVRLKAGAFDPLAEARFAAHGTDGPGVFIVQLESAAGATAREALNDFGAPLFYLPDDAYAMRLTPGQLTRIRGLAGVRWIGRYEPRFKVSPTLGHRHFLDPARATSRGALVFVFAMPGSSPAEIAVSIAKLGGTILRIRDEPSSRRILARVQPESVSAIAELEGVEWIEEVGEPRPRNDTTRWVIQSDVAGVLPLASHGLNGEGQIVGHIDFPIDLAHCMFFDTIPPGPSHSKIVGYRVLTSDADSHGTHTAGTIAGRVVAGLGAAGIASAARLSHTDLRLITGFGEETSNLDEMLLAAHNDGARIHSNSWGDDGTTEYTSLAQDIDAFSRNFEDDLVVFAVSNLDDLKTPENAKNVLAVGATEQAPDQANHCYGGSGPTADGRRKPEVYAPGCDIVSASADTECGLTSKSGTSMACAAVAGAAALVRQYYRAGFYPSGHANPAAARTPSGALLRATLINAAVDLTGVAGYPTDLEGWGRLLLDQALAFDEEPRRLLVRDLSNEIGLRTGDSETVELDVTDDALPLRVTMAFTDVPAALAASDAAVNDLDLVMEGPGVTFRGNSFDAGQSIPTGIADPKNTVEQILLLQPAVGHYTVRVVGTAVRMERQGYALCITGAVVGDLGPRLREPKGPLFLLAALAAGVVLVRRRKSGAGRRST